MYPSTIATLPDPQPTDRLNSPSHSALHQSENAQIEAIQTFVGTLSSVEGTLIHDIRSPDSDGGGHVQTANKGGTGQTAYTKGDLLVAASSSVLSKLQVGSDGQLVQADSTSPLGVKWGTGGTQTSSTIAISSVWTRPTGISGTSKVFVQLWGGGGSGGNASGSNEAGGGGGGGYQEGWFIASTLSASVLVQVGRGGNSRSGTSDGLTGGITVFAVESSLMTAYGGGGGASDSTSAGGGGGGGLRASGTIATNSDGGEVGGGPIFASIFGGTGGTTIASVMNAIYGGGGGGATNVGAGTLGVTLYGGGGGAGIGSSVLGGTWPGGISAIGGNGGASSILGAAVASAMSGMIPGGGGGAQHGAGSSGEGGTGMAIITTFF